MTRKTEGPLLFAVGSLLAALLVCICLLAFPAYNNKTSQVEIEVVKQEYTRRLEAMDRKYEQKINSLQEQINTRVFISNKRYDMQDEDMTKLKREMDDLQERIRLKAPYR